MKDFKIELSHPQDDSKTFREYLRNIEVVSETTLSKVKRGQFPSNFRISVNTVVLLKEKDLKMVDLLVDIASMIDIQIYGLITVNFYCENKEILNEMVNDDLLIRSMLWHWRDVKKEFHLEERPNSNPLAVSLCLDINGLFEKKLGKEEGLNYWCNDGPVYDLPFEED